MAVVFDRFAAHVALYGAAARAGDFVAARLLDEGIRTYGSISQR